MVSHRRNRSHDVCGELHSHKVSTWCTIGIMSGTSVLVWCASSAMALHSWGACLVAFMCRYVSFMLKYGSWRCQPLIVSQLSQTSILIAVCIWFCRDTASFMVCSGKADIVSR